MSDLLWEQGVGGEVLPRQGFRKVNLNEYTKKDTVLLIVSFLLIKIKGVRRMRILLTL